MRPSPQPPACSSATLQEWLLGLPFMNMFGNTAGFVGSYIIGTLNTKSGNFNASEWMMAGCSLVSAAAVLAFPLRWSTVVLLAQQAAAAAAEAEAAVEEGQAPAAAAAASSAAAPVGKIPRGRNSSLLALMVTGDALGSCPRSMLSYVLPSPEGAAALQQVRRAATWSDPHGGLTGAPSSGVRKGARGLLGRRATAV